jgi:hypothetical protein
MKAIVYAVLVVMAVVGSVTLVNGADDIAQVPSCKYCGMDRRTFAYSRMFIEYDNGTHEGFCSIHCAGVDLAVNIDKAPSPTSAVINFEASNFGVLRQISAHFRHYIFNNSWFVWEQESHPLQQDFELW